MIVAWLAIVVVLALGIVAVATFGHLQGAPVR
jgi:hypothetical protein